MVKATSPASDGREARRTPSRLVPGLLPFFGALFLYVWLVVDPSLLYECTGAFPAFLRGREFAAGFLWYPGGPAEYLAALLYQLHYYAWAGALVVTALAALLCWATGAIMGGLQSAQPPQAPANPRGHTGVPRWVFLVPPLLVLALSCRYGCNLAALLALTAAVVAAAGYMGAGRLRQPWTALLYAAMGGALYYVVAGPLLVFAVLCAIYEGRRGSPRLVGLLYLLAAEIVPALVGVRWLDVPPDRAWLALLPFGPGVDPQGMTFLVALCLFFPLAAYLTAWGSPLASRLRPLTHWWSAHTRHLGTLLRRPVMVWLLPPAMALVVGALGLSGLQRHCLRTGRCFSHGDWPGVLTEAARVAAAGSGVLLCHQVNAALYHQGRLLEEMFAYPQCPGGLVVGTAMKGDTPPSLLESARLELYFQLGEVDLELGLVNEAEHQAFEALECWGPHPTVLRRLAEICVIKKRPEAARVLLGALSQDLIWRPYATEALAELEAGIPSRMRDKVLRTRSVMLHEDDYAGTDFEKRCRALLRDNPRNRMAVEYLVAYHLLQRDAAWCAANVGLLKAAGYESLPRHVQEAIVLHEAQSGTRADLQGYEIETDTWSRFQAFSRIMSAAQAQGDIAQAKAQVASEHGNSFFYYFVFEESGAGAR